MTLYYTTLKTAAYPVPPETSSLECCEGRHLLDGKGLTKPTSRKKTRKVRPSTVWQ